MSSDGFHLNLERYLDGDASESTTIRASDPFDNEDEFPESASLSAFATKSAPRNQIISSNFDHASPSQVESSEPGSERFVIAVDYGTTYTGLAWARKKSENAILKDISVLRDWIPRSETMSNVEKVRTMISYGKSSIQWGSDHASTAITIVNTKLDLEPRESRVDELESTLHLLNGAGNLSFAHIRKIGPEPEFTTKSPTEIVTDYLTKIRECACEPRNINVERLVKTKTPIDLVITVPVNWSYTAKNATFKAFRDAGFNKTVFPTLEDTILVSEPEAASYFTAREVQATFLEDDQCFILCDAGGGTVDVVSYQVAQTPSGLKIKKATAPESGRCGSVFIDTAFKQWLLGVIGQENYQRLDPGNARRKIYPYASESGRMRVLIKRFEDLKKRFSESTEDEALTLRFPEPLHELNIAGRVNGGRLSIPAEKMEGFFEECVNRTIELIQRQIDRVSTERNRRVKNVFLVGGFGSSPYLQEKLERSLKLRKGIKLRKPDMRQSERPGAPEELKAPTAVVRGAVIYGIEKFRHTDAEYMSAVSRSYGIMVNQRSDSRWRFEWLIRKGDLILRNEKRVEQSRMLWLAPEQYRPTGKYELVIYAYRGREDDDVPEWWQDGQHEVEEVRRVSCDLTSAATRRGGGQPRPGLPYPQDSVRTNTQMGPLICKMELSGTTLNIEVLANNKVVGRSDVQVKTDHPFTSSTDILDEDDDDSM